MLLAIGLNPALQKTLIFNRDKVAVKKHKTSERGWSWGVGWERGEVNRVDRMTLAVGGKGQTVALAAEKWERGSAVVAQFLGGGSGELVKKMLAEGCVCVLVGIRPLIFACFVAA